MMFSASFKTGPDNSLAAVNEHIFKYEKAYALPTWMHSFRGRGDDFSGTHHML